MMTNPVVPLLQIIARWAQEKGDQGAVIFLDAAGQEKTCATYADLYTDLRHAGWAWRQHGVQPGEVVLLAAGHSYDQVTAFLGALYCGAVPVILPGPRPAALDVYFDQVEAIARQAQARALCAAAPLAAAAEKRLDIPGLGIYTFELAQAPLPPDDFAPVERAPDSPLYLQLTSGTTGAPKLAALTEPAVMRNIVRVAGARYAAGDVIVNCMPFHHDGGLVLCLLIPLALGSLSVHITPADWIAHPELLWIAVTAYRGTVSFLPNFALGYLARHIPHPSPKAIGLDSLQTVIVAAELVTYENFNRFEQHFSACGLKRQALCGAYGMAEQVVGVSFTRWGGPTHIDWISDQMLRTTGQAVPGPAFPGTQAVVSCGVPLPGVEVLIAGEDRRCLPERQAGEVLLRSDCAFSGYYGRPDLTAQALQDGWYSTGDLGYLADGELYILGRKDDLIIVAGQNLQPQALEEIAGQTLGKRGRLAVAFGVHDENLGTQTPVLVCETRDHETDDQLAAWRAEIQKRVLGALDVSLADIAFVPKGWVLQADTKISRRANRDKYLAERASADKIKPATSLPAQPTTSGSLFPIFRPRPSLETPYIAPRNVMETQIANFWVELLKLDRVGIQDNFFDLGGDSLDALQMTLQVEKLLNHRVPTDFFQRATVAHLAELISDPATAEATGSPPASPTRPMPVRNQGKRSSFKKFDHY